MDDKMGEDNYHHVPTEVPRYCTVRQKFRRTLKT